MSNYGSQLTAAILILAYFTSGSTCRSPPPSTPRIFHGKMVPVPTPVRPLYRKRATSFKTSKPLHRKMLLHWKTPGLPQWNWHSSLQSTSQENVT